MFVAVVIGAAAFHRRDVLSLQRHLDDERAEVRRLRQELRDTTGQLARSQAKHKVMQDHEQRLDELQQDLVSGCFDVCV